MNKTKWNKVLALLLALTMAIAMAACSSAASSSKAPSGNSSTAAPSPTSSAAASASEKVTYPLVAQKLTLQAWTKLADTIGERPFIQEYEKLTNVHVDWTSITGDSDWVTSIQLAISGDSLPDFTYNNGTNIKKADLGEYGENGYLVNLSEHKELLPNMFAFMEQYKGAYARVYFNEDRDMYSFPSYNFSWAGFGAAGMNYFIDKAEEIGYSAEKGNIPTTIEELYDMLVKAQEHFGAADKEFYAFRNKVASPSLPSRLTYTAFGSLQSGLWGIDAWGVSDNNKLVSAYTSDQFRAYLVFSNKCFEAGLVDPNAYTSDATANLAAIKAGHCLVTSAEGYTFSYADFANNEWNLGTIGALTSADYKTAHTTTATIGDFTNCFISAKCKNLDVLLKWFDAFYTTEENSFAEGMWGMSGWLGTYGVDWEFTDDARTVYKTSIPDGNIGFNTSLSRVCDWIAAPDGGNEGQNYFMLTNKQNIQAVQTEEAFPTGSLTLTDDEKDIISTYWTDISSERSASVAKFVTGEVDINDDAKWEAYTAKLEEMGMSKVLAAYQAAYDRYLAASAQLSK